MAERNFDNRTLYVSDNLPIMRGMNSETVDLIATDPPFNKGVKAFEGFCCGIGDGDHYADRRAHCDMGRPHCLHRGRSCEGLARRAQTEGTGTKGE